MNAVIDILKNDATVIASLAGGADGVNYLLEAQGQDKPYIVVESEILDPTDSMSGEKGDTYEVRVYIVAKYAYDEGAVKGCDDIGVDVRSSLTGTTGTHGGQTVQNIAFKRQNPTLPINFGKEKMFQAEQEFIVWTN